MWICSFGLKNFYHQLKYYELTRNCFYSFSIYMFFDFFMWNFLYLWLAYINYCSRLFSKRGKTTTRSQCLGSCVVGFTQFFWIREWKLILIWIIFISLYIQAINSWLLLDISLCHINIFHITNMIRISRSKNLILSINILTKCLVLRLYFIKF